jgi:hypothetical protein
MVASENGQNSTLRLGESRTPQVEGWNGDAEGVNYISKTFM